MAGCSEEWFESVSAWHDGEVTEADACRIEVHVARCAACRRAELALTRMRIALEQTTSTDVPERVRDRAAEALAPSAASRSTRRRALIVTSLLAAAALVLVALPRHGLPSAVKDELVNHHLMGFARERPCDFESSDPVAVASWLQGKLGYSVDVTVPPGSRLLGARLCHIEGAETAALMLVFDEKPLTVFVPAEQAAAAATAREFAGAGLRCTGGPLGKAICAKGVGRPLLAVAEVDPEELAFSLRRLP